MWRSLAVLTMVATPALGDDFAERWPQAVAVEPAPVVERTMIEKPPKAVRRARAQSRSFVCHRQTYYVRGHRYWRCRR